MENIELYLSHHINDEIFYFPNPGNAGDSLIAAATYQVFDKIGLTYHTPNIKYFDPSGKIVIYGGGGNLTTPHSFSAKVIKKCHKLAKKLIILPQTIRRNDELLKELGNNTEIFCRELISYEYVKSFSNKSNVYLTNDMAFNLDLDEFNKANVNYNPNKQLLKYMAQKILRKKNAQSLNSIIRSFGVRSTFDQAIRKLNCTQLNCYRIDGEKTDIPIPNDNIDLSELFSYGLEDKLTAYMTVKTLFEFIQHFDSVNTNRLHIAISCALLNKNSNFYSNNYYKNKAVYDFSIRGRYDNINWIENS
ncbi:polysaccharide pyruvyl transferase family protein [Methylomonas rapida]|uniref:Polysaccharide pyruvyl transferase family protein n=1 Tax=Methylomonas rapida TaxID=2963939 RepID=A0ABY7GNS8_9GAMM|nr:polysaccharide pyruvyl transferase family protein [Methylomonas rapida]WAR46164.1 polysaccharide pyruvyl transferase family protein [Methylomonas rapida]